MAISIKDERLKGRIFKKKIRKEGVDVFDTAQEEEEDVVITAQVTKTMNYVALTR